MTEEKKKKPLKILCHGCKTYAFDFVGRIIRFRMGIRSRDFVFAKSKEHPTSGHKFLCPKCDRDLVYRGLLLTNDGLRPERNREAN